MKRILLAFILSVFIYPNTSSAQIGDQSPELQQIITSAGNFLSKNDYDNAAAMYMQAIRMAPDNVALRRDLAYTYFLKKDFESAKQTIEPVLNSAAADEQTFQIAAVIEQANGNITKAKKIVSSGLDKYPNSGVLYNTKGNLLIADAKSNNTALKEWNNGIKKDPYYPTNYYNAAKALYQNNDFMWAVIYAEIFINLEPYTAKTVDMKKMLLDGYKKIFSQTEDKSLPGFNGENSSKKESRNFASAYKKAINTNISTISDGFTVDNLTMLRTRFLVYWNSNFARTYPQSLFTYQTKIIKNGHFNAYNQWLFGAVESSQNFAAWSNQFKEAIRNFEMWKKDNPYLPNLADEKPELK
ncbi:hypothetical protein DBR32_09590 [Taibaiella sp. KBW10]|uniref:tetratricopeptide repeat protein n=1 Tax=Taibaiella sp. KBW10 TaxID=2153357 RepID=UPI000F5A9C28|nr:tetratricopeptide repeat protein [Taibaiella sp. KBW10]RQO30951.1 hypothetical protein DBR32_09590 [Taibaiella sp. KBW10]